MRIVNSLRIGVVRACERVDGVGDDEFMSSRRWAMHGLFPNDGNIFLDFKDFRQTHPARPPPSSAAIWIT